MESQQLQLKKRCRMPDGQFTLQSLVLALNLFDLDVSRQVMNRFSSKRPGHLPTGGRESMQRCSEADWCCLRHVWMGLPGYVGMGPAIRAFSTTRFAQQRHSTMAFQWAEPVPCAVRCGLHEFRHGIHRCTYGTQPGFCLS